MPLISLQVRFFDENDQLISKERSFISKADQRQQLQLPLTAPEHTTYMKIGIFNQSEEVNAYFDNLKVTFNDYIVQENHYYPFGMNMAGIEKEGTPDHKWKFQGQEHQEELGWDSFKWRNADPTIGRFFNIDPLSESFYYNSTYAFSENKVTTHIELEGLEAYLIHGTASTVEEAFGEMTKSQVLGLTGNKTENREFYWHDQDEYSNGVYNDEEDRRKAAIDLADHVMKTRDKNKAEPITLVGHSHGGNVAIQAIDIIKSKLGDEDVKVNLITIATPAYNGNTDAENPANTKVDDHFHFYSGNDAIQVTGANQFGKKNASRTYNYLPESKNIEVKDYKAERYRGNTRERVYTHGSAQSHSIPFYNPQLLKK
ncbi:RHS repeat-associated core domain-containing protein [Flammeovirga aprica]|uniref:Fungal lipase-type domain-containing protein n=1 Tax=Flammeovirga aprica JL-4 TaxID=694437 RepID=A0A7X9S244_9BACT|nr:RHS repeat-associated core domain-containing protein [Flammeovirga aprica]NME72991.1 hypothetical protein [Flammeovirga aprica JL-4]